MNKWTRRGLLTAGVLAGGALVVRWPRMAWLHLPAVFWGALVQLADLPCPLTDLEFALRGEPDGAGFVARLLMPVLYPDLISPGVLTPGVRIGIGCVVIVVNVAFYGYAVRKRSRSRAVAAVVSSVGNQPLRRNRRCPMRYFLPLLVVAVAALAFAATSTQTRRVYHLDNDLTLDQNMSSGSPSVRCTNDTLRDAIKVKCPSDASWQTLSAGSAGTLDCPAADAGIRGKDAVTSDWVHYSVEWECSLGSDDAGSATRSTQSVDFTGDLSLCASANSITTESACVYSD